jgi:hypothetical protein
MESLERARLNHQKSPYPSIQLSHRLWLIGKNVLRTRNPMIGSLPAGGAGEEGRTGDKRSYANTFVLWRYTSEFRNDSDGIHSATLIRLSSKCRNRVQSDARITAAFNFAIHVGRLHSGGHSSEACSASGGRVVGPFFRWKRRSTFARQGAVPV